MQLLNEVVV